MTDLILARGYLDSGSCVLSINGGMVMKGVMKINGCLARRVIFSMLICIVLLLCGCKSQSARVKSPRQTIVVCDKNHEIEECDCDSVEVTHNQTCKKTAATRRANYWADQGYSFDPNSMTANEMDQYVKSIIFRRMASYMIWYVSFAQTQQPVVSEL